MNGTLSVLIILLAAALWGAVHSWLASLSAKALAARKLGPTGRRVYRLGYNVFAVVTFLPLLALVRLLPDRALYAIPSPWVYLTLALQGLAGLALAAGVLQTGPFTFAGLRQLVSGETDDNGPLVVNGLYRRVRHPLYSAGLVFVWLTPVMTLNLLTLYAALTFYIVVGAIFEERKLLKIYGEAYAAYRRRTPMFVPGIKL